MKNRKWYAFSKISFQYKLFFLMCITVLVIFAFYYGYFYSFIKNHFYKSAYDNLAASTDQLASNISGKLDYLAGLSNTIYSDYQVMQVLTREYNDPIQTVDLYQYIDKYMQRTLTADPYICAMTFYAVNEEIPADMKYIKHFSNLTDTVQVDRIVKANGAIVYGPVHEREVEASQNASDTNKNYAFSLMRLLNYFTYGANYGVLSIEVDVRELRTMFDKEQKNKDIYIVDTEGTVIACRKPSHTTRPLSSLVNIDVGTLDKGDFISVYQEERQKLAAYRQLKNGWFVIALVPYDEMVRDANRSLLGMLTVSTLLLLFSFLGIYGISRFFSHKITYLLHLIKKAESGQFDIQVSDMGDDELGKVIAAFGNMAGKVDYLMKEVYEKEIVRKSTELELLQAQINPHFLYNTLASIASLARNSHDERLIGMVVSLSDLYRISLNKGKKTITVAEEIELTRNYTRIMMYRFDSLVRVGFRYDDRVAGYLTPKLILQPFVENSISHGISGENGIDIRISAEVAGNKLIFVVEDNGCGMDTEVVGRCMSGTVVSRGYGIRNVQQRIAMTYGENFGVNIESTPEKGTKVTIYLPAIEQQE